MGAFRHISLWSLPPPCQIFSYLWCTPRRGLLATGARAPDCLWGCWEIAKLQKNIRRNGINFKSTRAIISAIGHYSCIVSGGYQGGLNEQEIRLWFCFSRQQLKRWTRFPWTWIDNMMSTSDANIRGSWPDKRKQRSQRIHKLTTILLV